MHQRQINLLKLLEKKSFFLFGPRSTGKSTLIQQQLDNITLFDLLERDTYKRLLDQPQLLATADANKITVIDEIQKIPFLLDEVHRLIQRENRKFLLTGSSARKLRRGSANLLAGRAWQSELFPLVSSEIKSFDLLTYLNHGGLPHIYGKDDYLEELGEYISLYLREEIAAEALTRNIEGFSQFLDLVALSNGMEINYQSFSSDCGLSPNTIKNYFQILEDTLIGFNLPAFTKTKKRKAITRAKHYLFDVGITNHLKKINNIQAKSKPFGDAFEHFIINEIRAYLSYKRVKKFFGYWRSVNKHEVDAVIEKEYAIEIKATEKIHNKHLRSLGYLKEEALFKNYIVVSLDRFSDKLENGIKNYYWEEFLAKMWTQKLF